MAFRCVLCLLLALSTAAPGVAALPDVFVRAGVDGRALAERGGAVYRVSVFSAVPVREERFSPPVADGFTAVDLGERRMATTLGGREYEIRERSWKLVPQRPGNLTVAGAVVSYQARLASAGRSKDPSRIAFTTRTAEPDPAYFQASPEAVAALAGPRAIVARAPAPTAAEVREPEAALSGEDKRILLLALLAGAPVAAFAAWTLFRLLRKRP